MNHPLNYRRAAVSDLTGIVDIYNSTVASRMVTADTEPVTVESRMNWFDEHKPAERPLLVIEDLSQKMLGWISFQSFYGRPAYQATAELSIYITQAERGKGIGKQALHHSMEICESLKIKTLLAFIFAHNEPSLLLFRKAGFEDWATLPGIAVLDGIERSLKILGKRVG